MVRVGGGELFGVTVRVVDADMGCARRLAGSESVHVESPSGHVNAFAPIAEGALRGWAPRREGPPRARTTRHTRTTRCVWTTIVRTRALALRRPCVSLAKEEETFGKIGPSLPTTIAFLHAKRSPLLGSSLDPLPVVFCTPCPLIVVLSYVWIPFIMDTVLCSNLGSLFVLIDYHRVSGSVLIGSI